MARLRLSACRVLMYMALGLVVFELLVVNIAILYVFSIQRDVLEFLSSSGSLIDKLKRVPAIKNTIFQGKGGGFANIMQNTLDRVFIVSDRRSNIRSTESDTSRQPSLFDRSDISHLALDVSSDGEALYLIRRMKQRGEAFSRTYRQLVIDIGANDGLACSNSFNLIQLGWDAILVEPQISLLRVAKENLRRYADRYNEEGGQRVILVNGVLGERDGVESVVLMEDDMETHILRTNTAHVPGRLVVSVPSMTVGTFAAKYNVPTRFSVLSIDAEGVGDKILHQWIDGGFEPGYIVYEALHNKESMVDTAAYLEHSGYRFMIQLGWNYIFEHQSHMG
ncbi:uncharacterized protein LOC143287951 [Babylonia areolata]|uniref:uncharacterized protein LOC143287951 n=1 Tax=Babylonia areolata TaxID=304850 RepID=UPI003FD06037